MINVNNCVYCHYNHKDIALTENDRRSSGLNVLETLMGFYPQKYYYICPNDISKNRIYVDVKNEAAITKLN